MNVAGNRGGTLNLTIRELRNTSVSASVSTSLKGRDGGDSTGHEGSSSD